MATPNYSYEKRQRELAKKRKNEEKLLKKKQSGPADGVGPGDDKHNNAPADATPGDSGSAPAGR